MTGSEAAMPRFTAAVVGLGRIGQGYDLTDDDSTRIRTHASAFRRHERYDLVSGVDPDPSARARFEAKFERPAYADVDAMLSRCRPDVVAIAVPTAQHLTIAERVIEAAPSAIVCEKPIARRRADGERMVALAAERGVALAVNYMRRFEPGVRALRDAVARGDLGEIVKGTAWYTKGLRENGSHLIDLLRFVLGEATDVRVLDPGRELGDDAEPDVSIRFGKTPVYLLAARHEAFFMADVTLVGTLGTARYGDGGAVIEVRHAVVEAGERRLAREPDVIASDLARYQWHVVDALYRTLAEGAALASDGRSATDTLAVVEAALEERARW